MKYAPEELYNNALSFLGRQQAKNASRGYQSFPGRTMPAMSDLTQRGFALQERYAGKQLPYSNKINTLLSRDNYGIRPSAQNALLGNIGNAQNAFANNMAMKAQANFGGAYNPAGFLGTAAGDINSRLGEFGSKLSNMGTITKNLEDQYAIQAGKTMQGLQEAKQTRRDALIGSLFDFGNQKHTLEAKKIGADRAAFDAEMRDPQRRQQLLLQQLTQAQAAFDDPNVPPNIKAAQGQQIAQALRAYGIDPSLPADQWEASAKGYKPYPGQLVADATPEMKLSYDLIGNISPKFRDNFYDQRKALMGNVVNGASIADRALNNLPTATNPAIAALEKQAEERLQKDIGAINNRYTGYGAFGSGAHKKAIEERMKEIQNAVLDSRGKEIEGALGRNIANEQAASVNDLERLNMLGKQGFNNYAKIMRDVRDINKRGTDAWSNLQAENEQQFKDFNNARDWEYPMMRGQMRNEAFQDVLGAAFGKGISLDDLVKMKANYSNLEKERSDLLKSLEDERNSWQGKIKTEQDYYNTRLAEFQKMNQERIAEEQRLAAQRAREEENRRAAAERDRLARETAERDRIAREAAERNRLASIASNVSPVYRPEDYRLAIGHYGSAQAMNSPNFVRIMPVGAIDYANRHLVRQNTGLSGDIDPNYYPAVRFFRETKWPTEQEYWQAPRRWDAEMTNIMKSFGIPTNNLQRTTDLYKDAVPLNKK